MQAKGLDHSGMAAALACGAAAGLVLARYRRRVRGTTLIGPWAWSCAALAAVLAAELFVDSGAAATLSKHAAIHVRYLAAITTLAPIVSLLGAKRPQDRAWQWIVFSLLALLALPSIKAIAFDGGAPPEPHAAWRWLIAVIALAGLFNYLPTRFALSAALFFFGQSLLLAEYLPGPKWPASAERWLLGLACLAAAPLAASMTARRRTPAAAPEDRLWLDFRNAFGALWALRVAERFNASAAQCGWNVWLSWSGLRSTSEAANGQEHEATSALIADEFRPALHQAMKSLLWRFVSSEWIDERLDTTDRRT